MKLGSTAKNTSCHIGLINRAQTNAEITGETDLQPKRLLTTMLIESTKILL